MTPQIALDLSLDGIAVLSRAEDGVWWREGVVRLDADDMAEGLARLRARAAARVGEDFTSILLIPDSQLMFTSLERDDRDPKVTIRSLLHGRTPYAIEDLAFDYVQTGDRLQVAVVALETLMEAEEFAAGFGFRPMAILGNPQDSTYPGRPNFGQTAIAADILAGEKLTLDLEDRLDVVPAPFPPDVPEEEAALDLPDATQPDAATPLPAVPPLADSDLPPADESVAPFAAEASEPGDSAPTDAPETFAAAMAETDAPVAESTDGDPVSPTFSTRRRPERPDDLSADVPPTGRATPRLSGPDRKEPDAPMPPAVPNAAPADARTDADASGSAPQVTEDAPPLAPPGLFSKLRGRSPKTATSDTADSEAVALALPGLAREKAGAAQPTGGARLGLVLTLALLALLGVVALWSLLQDEAPGGDLARDTTPALPETSARVDTEDDPPISGSEDDLANLLPEPGPAEPVSAPDVVSPPVPLPQVAPRTAPEPDSFETAGNFQDSPSLPDAPVAQTDADVAPSTTDPARPDPEIRPLPATTAPDAGPATPEQAAPVETPDDPIVAAPDPDADPAEVPEVPADVANLPVGPIPDEEEAAAAPPVGPEIEADAVATAEEETETGPVDAPQALVPASPEGTLAPGRYRVFAGRPPVEPVQRAETATAPVETVEEAEVETAPALTAEEEAARLVLRRTRPIARPVDDASAPVVGAEEALPPIADGFTREELTRTRPLERPQSLTDAAAARDAEAEAAREAAADERSAAVEAAAAAAVASLASQATLSVAPSGQAAATGSGLALALSDRPRTRPRSVEREAAQIVTQRRQQRATPAAAASSSAEETDGEEAAPRAQRSNQTIRSAGGSVARAATQQNAIRLREINLIGVYGRPNARRALVRLANGRYVKVEVGDRLDRGRVTAIGQNQLVYQRGGRNVALSLPST